MRNEINAVDLAFVVDTTGSMGNLIATAQQQMVAMLRELTQAADINLWLGVVEYRDHPPQDTMVYKVHAFTDNLAVAQKTIMRLKANGGGDAPEAVLEGRVARQVAAQDLDRDVPGEPDVPATEDLRHAAVPEHLADLVTPAEQAGATDALCHPAGLLPRSGSASERVWPITPRTATDRDATRCRIAGRVITALPARPA